MSKINKIINIAIMITLIRAFFCVNIIYAGEACLRIPFSTKDQAFNDKFEALLSHEESQSVPLSVIKYKLGKGARMFLIHELRNQITGGIVGALDELSEIFKNDVIGDLCRTQRDNWKNIPLSYENSEQNFSMIMQEITNNIISTRPIVTKIKEKSNNDAFKNYRSAIKVFAEVIEMSIRRLPNKNILFYDDNDINKIIDYYIREMRKDVKFTRHGYYRDDLIIDKITEGESLIILGILDNFIENAKRELNGSTHITIKTFRRGRWIVLRVSDKGPGIPREILPKIFDEYFTTRESGQDDHHGLGLHLTLEYLKRKGGMIEVFTKANGEEASRLSFDDKLENKRISPSRKTDVGTTFTMYLPISKKILVQPKPSLHLNGHRTSL